MTTSPLSNNTDLVSYSLLIQGTEIDGSLEVYSIYAALEEDETASAEVTILLRNDMNILSSSGLDDFSVGSEVEVKLGYHSKNETVFKGKITTQSFGNSEALGFILTVECYDSNASNNPQNSASTALCLTLGEDVIDVVLNQYEAESDAISTIGSVLFQGSSVIQPGHKVELKGFMKAFEGEQIVKRVEHLVSEGQWTTEIDI
jgi:phage protein D